MNQTQRVIVIDSFITNLAVLKDLIDLYKQGESKDPITVKLMDEFESYVKTLGRDEGEIFKFLSTADDKIFETLAEKIVQIQHRVYTEAKPTAN